MTAANTVMQIRNTIPTDLAQLVLFINSFELARLGDRYSRNNHYADYQRYLAFIRLAMVDMAGHPAVGRLGGFLNRLLKEEKKLVLDDWIDKLVGDSASVYLTFYRLEDFDLGNGNTVPPWIQTAFVNSRDWGLTVEFDAESVALLPDWIDVSKKTQGEFQWDVVYRVVRNGGCWAARSVEESTTRLNEALGQAQEYAVRTDRLEFSDVFGASANVLEQGGLSWLGVQVESVGLIL